MENFPSLLSKVNLNNFLKLDGHYKICVFSQDKDFYYKRKFIKLSLIFDTDQEEFDGRHIKI